MTALSRVRTVLSGWNGGPGVSTMYFLDTATAVQSVHDFWAAVSVALPNDVHVQVQSNGDIIEDTTGAITGAWGADPVADVVGQAAVGYAAPAGAIVGWDTSTILDGRRVRGRTFLVPLSVANYQDDGTLNTDTVAAFVAAALEFRIEQADSFVIWHRPFEGRPAIPPTATKPGKPAKPAHLGGHALSNAGHVPDRVAILRSRRG